jgi:hypothetical protein
MMGDRIGRYWNLGKNASLKYKLGDLVMLKTIIPKTRRPSKKLDSKLQNPF